MAAALVALRKFPPLENDFEWQMAVRQLIDSEMQQCKADLSELAAELEAVTGSCSPGTLRSKLDNQPMSPQLFVLSLQILQAISSEKVRSRF